jgi:S1-C subfamily serine protease
MASVGQQTVLRPNFSAFPNWTLMVDGWVDFEGFNIVRVHQGSPLLGFLDSLGRQCFLEPGDVISHVNGRKVTSINQFLGLIRNAPNPRQHHLQVINWRNGEMLTFVIAAKKAG